MTGLELAPEATTPVLVLAVLGLVTLFGAAALGRWRLWLGAVVLIGAATLAAFLARDPERAAHYDPADVLSPADGRVLAVDSLVDAAYLGGPMHRIRLRTGLADVRALRSPVDGVIDLLDRNDSAARIGINTGEIRVLIEHDPRTRHMLTEGQLVDRAQRAGFLPLGARLDVVVPAWWELRVLAGDRVRAGESVVARVPDR